MPNDRGHPINTDMRRSNQSAKIVNEDGSLGNLNPTPWAFMTGNSDRICIVFSITWSISNFLIKIMTGNCIGWIAYSYITLDLFVFFANAPGVRSEKKWLLSILLFAHWFHIYSYAVLFPAHYFNMAECLCHEIAILWRNSQKLFRALFTEGWRKHSGREWRLDSAYNWGWNQGQERS